MDYPKQGWDNAKNKGFKEHVPDSSSPKTPIDLGAWKPLPGYRLKAYEMPINTPPNTCQPRVFSSYRTSILQKPLEGHKPITWS